MAKVNMDEIKKTVDNSTEIEELKANEQAEVNTEPVESTNNASDTTENTNEIEQTTEAEETKKEASDKVIVTYVGGGIWKDSHGELWASSNKSVNILSERQYKASEYEKREDIKFMVAYGAMKETYVK